MTSFGDKEISQQAKERRILDEVNAARRTDFHNDFLLLFVASLLLPILPLILIFFPEKWSLGGFLGVLAGWGGFIGLLLFIA